MNQLMNAMAACVLSTVVASGAYAGAVQSSANIANADTVLVARADTALASGMVKTSGLASTRTRSGDLQDSSAEAAPAEEPADLDTMALLAGLVLVVGIAMRRLRA
jgi:hypothetical protein